MNITIEPVNFNASQDLLTRVREMFESLIKYHDRIVAMDIYLKSLQETPGKDKEVSVKVFLPGKEVFLDHTADSFVSAAQQTFDKLKIQISKEKEKDKNNRAKRADKF
ncbi:MAG: HPF/RaiA family ribosome-associated protein [Cyclobacteriaceae bacterium]|nr:HPF/RaiA family ribosome-associated protein [Cyclobacteriaceae bacterium]MCH8516844.1 HPF/RaiA family ribosome-associated protein [Cyclobacteriaceae bacterium]